MQSHIDIRAMLQQPASTMFYRSRTTAGLIAVRRVDLQHAAALDAVRSKVERNRLKFGRSAHRPQDRAQLTNQETHVQEQRAERHLVSAPARQPVQP